MDVQSAQQFYELQKRHQNNIKLLKQVRAKHNGCRRDAFHAQLVQSELANFEGTAYRSLGRCFIRESPQTLRDEAQAAHSKAIKDQEKFEKQSEFLMAKVKENEQQLVEMQKQRK